MIVRDGNRIVKFGEKIVVSPEILYMLHSIGNNTIGGSMAMGNKTDYEGIVQEPSLNGKIKNVYGGDFFGVILMKDGTVRSFGANWGGQLGMGNTDDYSGALVQPNLSNVEEVIMGYGHWFVKLKDGTYRGVGSNNNGELCMGNTTNYGGAIVTPDFSGVRDVYVGNARTFLVNDNDTAKVVGGNGQGGPLGLGHEGAGSDSLVVPDFPVSNIKKIVSGRLVSGVLYNDGTLRLFGVNLHGQLMKGNNTDYAGVIQTPSYTNVVDIMQAGSVTWLVLDNGDIKVCGQNTDGQMGMGNTTDYVDVIQTVGTSNIKRVVGRDDNGAYIMNDGTARIFGKNDNGELMNGDTSDHSGALINPGFTRVENIEFGSMVSYAITKI